MTVIVIRQGDRRPDVQAVLRHTDAVVDLSAADDVRFVTRDMAGDVVIDAAATVVDAPTGSVAYLWGLTDTATVGSFSQTWRVRWGTAWETFPTIGDVSIAIMGPTPVPGVGLTWGEVETSLGRPLTDQEVFAVPGMLGNLIGTLGMYLNRPLMPTRFPDETHWSPPWGVVLPNQGPVTHMLSMTVMGAYESLAVVDTSQMPSQEWRNIRFPPGASIRLDYWAGEDLSADPAVRQVLLDAVTGTLLSGSAVASGAVASYSVEGTSITWANGGGSGGESVSRVSAGSMAALKRLRRPVWR